MSNAARDIQPRILSVPEVAKLLGRTELSTRRAIERGVIPARKLGTRVVILADELEAFLRAVLRSARWLRGRKWRRTTSK